MTREIIEVYALAMHPEACMGAEYLVAPVPLLEEKQSWFLLGSKQNDVVVHKAFGTPFQKMSGILKAYRYKEYSLGVRGEIGRLCGRSVEGY